MENITDYICWYADFSFTEKKFNEADNLVFSKLAYYSFDKAAEQGTFDTVRNCLNNQIKDDDFIRAVVNSKRFGDLIVSDYREIFDHKASTQFSAVTFHLNNRIGYIAFRGTDDTIAGWKEDFMISYTKTEAQKRALDYLSYTVKDGCSYYVGGHSKGGNLALYACCHLSNEKISAVRHIFVNDGPGLCPEVSDLSLINKIRNKTTLIMPEYAVMGKLFEPNIPDRKIVRSSAEGIMQHKINTWGIKYGHLYQTNENDSGSLWVNQVFDKWIEGETAENRQRFVNSLFSALEANGAKTTHEIADGGILGLENILHSILEAETATKKTAVRLPIKALFGNFFHYLKNMHPIKAVNQSHFLQGIVFIILGISMLIVPKYMFQILIIAVLSGIVLIQSALTVRALYKSKWNFKKEQTRVNLSAVLIMIFCVILVKEQALFIVGSAIFGIWLFYLFYRGISTAKKSDKSHFTYWKNIFVSALFAVCGAFILVVPYDYVRWFAFGLGCVMLADGIATTVHTLLKTHTNQRVTKKRIFTDDK